MTPEQVAATKALSGKRPLRFAPHLISTGLPPANKNDYGNRVDESMREAAKIESVPISDLHAVQRGVDPARVQHYIDHPEEITRPGRLNSGGYLADMPIVVRKDRKLYLHDGHHRVVATTLMGGKTIKARVVNVTGSKLRAWAK